MRGNNLSADNFRSCCYVQIS